MADSVEDRQELEWIQRAKYGDAEAFGLLVQHYERRVFSLVYHVLNRREEVEDLAQEIFVKAFLGVRGYDGRSSFATWLSRVAINHCYDHLRRQRTSRLLYFSQMNQEGERALEAKAESPSQEGINVEERMALRDLAGKLLSRAPAEDRILLGLKELEDLSVEEIGELLGLKESTVKVRLHRARKRMLEDFRRWQRGR
jgi:RNA polymerase sigma-70 factor (ECF subfamily)